MAQAPAQSDGKKIAMILLTVACLAIAGYVVYTQFAEPSLPPLPAPTTPEESKPSEPAPLPPNVKRPKPG